MLFLVIQVLDILLLRHVLVLLFQVVRVSIEVHSLIILAIAMVRRVRGCMPFEFKLF